MSDFQPILQDLTAIADELAEVGDGALLAIKAGKRHSAGDEGFIQDIYTGAQQIADLAVQLGATEDGEDADEETEEIEDEPETGDPDALKMLYNDPVLYAQHECGDVMAACAALQALAQLAGSELGEEHPAEGTLPQITKAMRLLVGYINKEIDGIEGGGMGEAAKAINYDQSAQLIRDAWMQAHPAEHGAFSSYPQAVFDDAIIISDKGQLYRVTYRRDGDQVLFADQPAWQVVCQVYVAADGSEIKAVMVESSDTLGGATVPADAKAQTFGGKKRDDLKDSDFGDPKARKFPIMTAQDVKDAASLIGKADDPDAVKQRIIAIAKRKGFAIPDAWKEKGATKGIEFAVKMLDDDTVEGPAVWFGSPDQHDLSPMRDFFTKSTDFWLDAWDKRPMIWHHALPQSEILNEMRDAGATADEIKAMREALDYLDTNPVVGIWNKATVDPMAVWMQGQISKAHKYRSAVKRMIDMGLIKISTDSAPHLVRRERAANGAHEIKRWPIIAASLTPTAAEPRLYDVQAMKAWYDEAGLTLPDAVADEGTAKTIELELLAIEAEYAELAVLA